MRKLTQILVVIAVSGLALGLVAVGIYCDYRAHLDTIIKVTVEELNAHPERYDGQMVRVSGYLQDEKWQPSVVLVPGFRQTVELGNFEQSVVWSPDETATGKAFSLHSSPADSHQKVWIVRPGQGAVEFTSEEQVLQYYDLNGHTLPTEQTDRPVWSHRGSTAKDVEILVGAAPYQHPAYEHFPKKVELIGRWRVGRYDRLVVDTRFTAFPP